MNIKFSDFITRLPQNQRKFGLECFLNKLFEISININPFLSIQLYKSTL